MAVVVAPVGEVLAAVLTLKGALASVDALVRLQKKSGVSQLVTQPLFYLGYSYLPDVLVGEGLSAVAASVQVLAGVNVSVLAHVVHGRVVLATIHAHDTTLVQLAATPAVCQLAEAVAGLSLLSGWRRIDLVHADDVVRIVVGNVTSASAAAAATSEGPEFRWKAAFFGLWRIFFLDPVQDNLAFFGDRTSAMYGRRLMLLPLVLQVHRTGLLVLLHCGVTSEGGVAVGTAVG